MSKKAVANRQIAFGMILDLWRIWRSRPNRRRDWQVIATFGGGTYRLRNVRENEIAKSVAGNARIVYIDSVNGLVFIDDGSRPGNTQTLINR